MSTQKFEDEFREALWLTYSQKCFFHAGFIELVDMEIDHIVPESLLDSGNVSAELAKYGLPSTFDIRGQGNLVPSCGKCNSRKTGMLVPINQAIIFLAQVEKKRPSLADEYKKLVEGVALNYLLSRAVHGVNSGRFTKEQMQAGLKAKGLLDFSLNVPRPLAHSANRKIGFKRVMFADAVRKKISNGHELISRALYAISQGAADVKPVHGIEKLYEMRISVTSRLYFTFTENETITIVDIIDKRDGLRRHGTIQRYHP